LRKKGINTFDFKAIIVAIADLSRVEIMERLTGEKNEKSY
jgi:hypothetical protein